MTSPRLRQLEREFTRRQQAEAQQQPHGDLEQLIRELIRQEMAEQHQPARVRAVMRSQTPVQADARAKLAEAYLPPFLPIQDRQDTPTPMVLPEAAPRPSAKPPAPLRRPTAELVVRARDALGRVAKMEGAAFSMQLLRDELGKVKYAMVTPVSGPLSAQK